MDPIFVLLCINNIRNLKIAGKIIIITNDNLFAFFGLIWNQVHKKLKRELKKAINCLTTRKLALTKCILWLLLLINKIRLLIKLLSIFVIKMKNTTTIILSILYLKIFFLPALFSTYIYYTRQFFNSAFKFRVVLFKVPQNLSIHNKIKL